MRITNMSCIAITMEGYKLSKENAINIYNSKNINEDEKLNLLKIAGYTVTNNNENERNKSKGMSM